MPINQRHILFAVVAALLPLVLIELTLAGLGVRPITATRDPFAGFSSHLPLFVPGETSNAQRRVTAPNKLRFFNEQSFAHPKPPGTFRIFCMGGSTTYGHPYRDPVSFPGWLREILRAAAPGQAWEVINCGGISYASYREAALMEELAQYQPDLFIVVNGHNEFLEKRTYGRLASASAGHRALHRWVASLRLYTVLDKLIAAGRRAAPAKLSDEVHTLLDESVGLDAYARDDALREQVVAHYGYNLRRMVDVARDSGAKILLATPASQLRDCAPFKSEGVAAAAEATLRELQWEVQRDPRQAANRYRLAEGLLAEGRAAEARVHFEAARDEDIVPLRALTVMGKVVREVGRERGVPVLDVERAADVWARERSGIPIPGSELFTDHVHFTLEGYRLLALAVLRALNEHRLLPVVVEPSAACVERVVAEVEGRQDRRDQGLALRNLAKTLSWAGKSEEASRLAGQAMEKMGEDAECFFVQAVAAAERKAWAEAEPLYRRALALDPDYPKAQQNLAIVLGRLKRDEEAIALYEAILSRHPKHPHTAYNLALAYERVGAVTQAMHWLRVTLEQDGGDADARALLDELQDAAR